MKINITSSVRRPTVDQAQFTTNLSKSFRPSSNLVEIMGLCGLTLLAFIARIILASQLDLVTDERVYIFAGKIYMPLLARLNFTSYNWNYNYEHPPLAKILIGLAMSINFRLGYPVRELIAARLPGVLAGTALVVIIYLGTRRPFGRVVAGVAALCVAVSPWMVYFSALAYLDMTMAALATSAYLLLWPALRRPALYPVAALCLGLAAASKYTAVLISPALLLFPLYYFTAIRPRLKKERRPAVPWRWWIASIVLAPLSFLAVNPAIWRSPIYLLLRSFDFELNHAENGHITFLAGQASTYVPHWAVLYILSAKISLFVTIPAILFTGVSLFTLYKFHLRGRRKHVSTSHPTEDNDDEEEDRTQVMARRAFVLIWLVTIVVMLSQLNIIVGTHYLLPAMPPIALAGTLGLAWLLRYRPTPFFTHQPIKASLPEETGVPVASLAHTRRLNWRKLVTVGVLGLAIVGPHLLGLLTVYGAEGYTSELYHGENSSLQVAYPAYREGALWLARHTRGDDVVGLVAKYETLTSSNGQITWNDYNSKLPGRLHFIEVQPDSIKGNVNYLIWPMHLVQRNLVIPANWHSHIVHVISGGSTTYCYILARDPSTIIHPTG